MAANTSPIVPGAVSQNAVTFTSNDGTNSKVVYLGKANGSRIDAVSITSTDTVAHTFNVIINDGANDHIVSWVTIPITAGTDGVTKAVTLLSTLWLPWLSQSGSVWAASNWSLKLAAQAPVSAGKLVDVVAWAGDY